MIPEQQQEVQWMKFPGGSMDERSRWEMERVCEIEGEQSHVEAYKDIEAALVRTCNSLKPTLLHEGTSDKTETYMIPDEQIADRTVNISKSRANGLRDYWITITDKKSNQTYYCIVTPPGISSKRTVGSLSVRLDNEDHSITVLHSAALHILGDLKGSGENEYYIDPQEQAAVRGKMKEIAGMLEKRLKQFGPASVQETRRAIDRLVRL